MADTTNDFCIFKFQPFIRMKQIAPELSGVFYGFNEGWLTSITDELKKIEAAIPKNQALYLKTNYYEVDEFFQVIENFVKLQKNVFNESYRRIYLEAIKQHLQNFLNSQKLE